MSPWSCYSSFTAYFLILVALITIIASMTIQNENSDRFRAEEGTVASELDHNSSFIESSNRSEPVKPVPNSGLTPETTTLSSEVSEENTEDSTLSIPGTPGLDYPIYNEIPPTGFDCQKQRYKGFFADLKTNCQAWHYCDFSDGQSTFLCPNGTLFNQVLLTCDWWFNVNCKEAVQLYVLNERLYHYVKAPKPTFPEDFHGPEVDLWLKRQHQLGLLPKASTNNIKIKTTD